MGTPTQIRPVFFRHGRLLKALALAGVCAARGFVPAGAAEDAPLAIEASNSAPKARLAVTAQWFNASADASKSTDTDAWPIARYQFDFGDKTPVVVTTAPTAVATHTYAKTGSYKVKLYVIDTAGKKSSSTSVSISIKAPPPEKPPVAKLKITKPYGGGFIVTGDGSGSTDVDLTPVASYRFDFGDGTSEVTVQAPTSSAQHQYNAAGTYTVKLTVTDTGGNVSKPVTGKISVTAPPDDPPVARLAVTKPSSTSLQVFADASASTDVDLTPIVSYRFDFGDGTAAVETPVGSPVVGHTYAVANFYTITLVATDGAGKKSNPATLGVVAGVPPPPSVAVYSGYYDTHHPALTRPKPDPWMGSSSIVFVGKPDGSSGGWDSSCLRIENLTNASIGGVVVSVDIGSKHYALWGTNTIPAGKSLVLAQTSMENFDGSDTNPAGCYGCNPADCARRVMNTIPVVHVTIGGRTTDYFDTKQVLNTRGVDGAGCPATGTRNDESHAWERIYPSTGTLVAESAMNPIPQNEYWLAAPFPNPVHAGDVGINFRIPEDGYVRLVLYDVAGRVQKTDIDGLLDEGEYHRHIRLSGMSPGIYFADLHTPQGTLRRAFVVVK